MLARFIPLVETVLNPLAGTVQVPIRVFTLWQVIGGVLWAVGVTLAGYVLGTRIPNVDQYLLPDHRRHRPALPDSGRARIAGGSARGSPGARGGCGHPVSGLLQRLLDVPTWTLLTLVGLIVFAEDALFVGFVLPGETAALLAGVAAKLGHAPLPAVLAVVILVAIIGDTVGYEIGRHFGSRVLDLRILDKRRGRLPGRAGPAGQARRVGRVPGRWVAFFRAVMPALAGTARMPYPTFLAFNAAGGITWGATVVMAGYLAGASYARGREVARPRCRARRPRCRAHRGRGLACPSAPG